MDTKSYIKEKMKISKNEILGGVLVAFLMSFFFCAWGVTMINRQSDLGLNDFSLISVCIIPATILTFLIGIAVYLSNLDTDIKEIKELLEKLTEQNNVK